MDKLAIKRESAPQRCEICHQSDCFNSETNYCSRCAISLHNTDAPLPVSRADIKQPRQITIEHSQDMLKLTQNWRPERYLQLVILLGAGIIATLFIAVIFHIFAILSAIVNIYFPLAFLINRTVVKVKNGELVISNSPLYWPGGQKLKVANIKQFYSKQVQENTRSGLVTCYELHAQLNNGSEVRLLNRLQSKEVALHLEQQLEQYLGITDQPVAGEIPRQL